MADERFEEHLRFPQGSGVVPADSHTAIAGGSACGDVVRFHLAVRGANVVDAGFDAEGCGATCAAASAAVELVRGRPVLDAARVGTHQIAQALGGLSPGKLHAAELAADALAGALGAAAHHAAALAPPADGQRLLVAMSGGVDSAVAALLARSEGAEVVAVTLELWRDADNDAQGSCCSAVAVRRARSLAHQLGIAHLTLDLRDAFRAGVVDPWIAGHAAGFTPNPCVRCNGEVRIDAMIAMADRLGAAALVTGHYARVGEDGLLRAAADAAKDQSYMLAALEPSSLERLRFPLGALTKDRVRELAAEAGLAVARQPDSQDLCFLAGTTREAFLARHGGVDARPGRLVDAGGSTIGRHRGAHGYTVGQRRGLGSGGGTGDPLYVIATDVAENTVTVGTRQRLLTSQVRVSGVRLHRPAEEVTAARLRYHAEPVACTLVGEMLELHEPVWGIAPGQTAVLLEGDRVLGCATIAR
ncbi:unannotated protein [freshwater metagenome]|uniref:Unannotated protein n=1 Tax=freshwater metagenome TaxID=449393 RepID=A0A6J7D4W2_9ZZZZ|nr:tRNA 2-thiouridine(34) synthase MnmA [Actinomycetota bacterium]